MLPDGSFKPETYALGNGAMINRTGPDASLDETNFRTVAATLAASLAARGYISTADPAKIELLIMIHLGRDPVSVDFVGEQALAAGFDRLGDSADGSTLEVGQIAAANQFQQRNGEANARLLGYVSELNNYEEDHEYGPLRHRLHDVLDELRDNRYYAILVAYDFRLLWKEKKLRPRWIARISLPTQGNDFVRQLPSMFDQASRFLGENSPGLIRQALPEVDIQYGDLRVIDQDTPVKK